ncbi:FtsK/SpoIIIE domain-containing protein [Rarobacter incanus]|uniref:S-DNA-T family DNA segregation ATPase FtsK/SpoIIIE n=1 Tax=Rarobacter incanus TaxID=153494 RepID=A0A542SRL3_9MICO|nr:FtsK/SpoIIIE domain-containing protein [Rarobacter incanus]TQK77266.1 S-DNA-T family DNA segregation ATPase FtsK/SpoIIIE [Rarobacter incanus]
MRWELRDAQRWLVILECDSNATVGMIAHTIAGAIRGVIGPALEPMTLCMSDTGAPPWRPVAPAMTLAAAGIRSGASIRLLPVSAVRVADMSPAPWAMMRVRTSTGATAAAPLVTVPAEIGRGWPCDLRVLDGAVPRRALAIEPAGRHHQGHLTHCQVSDPSGSWTRIVPVPGSFTARGLTCEIASAPGGRVATAGGPFAATGCRNDLFEAILPAPDVHPLPPPPRAHTPAAEPAPASSFAMGSLAVSVGIPACAGIVLWAATGQTAMLSMTALSLAIGLGTMAEQWWRTRRELRLHDREHARALAAAKQDAAAAHATYVAALDAAVPDAAAAAAEIAARGSRIWCRQPGNAKFLTLRLGYAAGGGSGEAAAEGREAAERLAAAEGRAGVGPSDTAGPTESASLTGRVLLVNLREKPVLGVCGVREDALALARAAIVQLIAFHSPSHVRVMACVPGSHGADWRWLAWLPHVRPGDGLTDSDDDDGVVRMQDAVEREIASRLADRGNRPEAESTWPAVVIALAWPKSSHVARWAQVARTGGSVGVHVIWVAAAADSLPPATSQFVEMIPAAHFVDAETGLRCPLRACDSLDAVAAEAAARSLAPCRDGSGHATATELAHRVGLVAALGSWATDPAGVASRWSDPPAGLTCPIGLAPAASATISLVRDGPHALVGGTTGSGKSEFLQAWVLALAANYSPRDVTFLLIDFKGGATFARAAQLPHVVGVVTDLSDALVMRVLVSLRAEIRHREQVLAHWGCADVGALRALRPAVVLPPLVIVIDEFAALVTEVPDFIEGIIDIARRGRSLGIHLILATQRPAGVVSDNVRANTSIKVCLRVASAEDSIDVIGVDAAYRLPKQFPGRAFLKIGAEPAYMCQSAYAGEPASSEGPRPMPTLCNAPGFARAPDDFDDRNCVDARRRDAAGDVAARPSNQLEQVTAAIAQAALAAGEMPPRRPWLDPLPAVVRLAEIEHLLEPRTITLGLLDDPATQSQPPWAWDLSDPRPTFVIGGPGSGKTSLLHTVVAAVGRYSMSELNGAWSGPAVQVHILDAVGDIDPDCGDVPVVVNLIRGTDRERLGLALQEIAALAGERRNGRDTANEPPVIVLVNGIDVLARLYERDMIGTLGTLAGEIARAGALGIHLLATAASLSEIPHDLRADGPVIVRIGVGADGVTRSPGAINADPERGSAQVEGRIAIDAKPRCEGQEVEDAHGFRRLAARIAAAGVVRPGRPVVALPAAIALSEVTRPDSPRPDSPRAAPVVGIAAGTLRPVAVEWDRGVRVTGGVQAGKTTAALTLLYGAILARSVRAPLVVAPDSRAAEVVPPAVAAVSEIITGASQCADLLRDAAQDARTDRLAWDAVVVLEAAGFGAGDTEGIIAGVCAAATRNRIPVVIESDETELGRCWSLLDYARTLPNRLIMNPTADEAAALEVERWSLAPVAGRAIISTARAARVVQVALPM